MKAMVTSFGVEHSLTPQVGRATMFYRMPPVSHRWISEAFMPDYELLLLCDTIVMDEASFERLVQGSVAAYSKVSETFQALHSEGRIELNAFSATLRPHAELLGRMIDNDLKSLDQWVEPLRESLTVWQHFSQMSMKLLDAELGEWSELIHDPHLVTQSRPHYALAHEVYHMMHADGAIVAPTVPMLVSGALQSSTKRKRKQYRDALRDVLRAYLGYVNANLVLSHQLDVGFHDWLDFTPFYAAKFLSVGRDEEPIEARRAQLEKLFTVPFPELEIRDTRGLMKALNDKRVEDLRRLVADAADGRVEFDSQFAKSVLTEVFRSLQRSKRLRSIVGYVSLPIDLLPWVGTVAQKAVEEVAGFAIERKYQRKHRWFYMLSEIAERTEGTAEQ